MKNYFAFSSVFTLAVVSCVAVTFMFCGMIERGNRGERYSCNTIQNKLKGKWKIGLEPWADMFTMGCDFENWMETP